MHISLTPELEKLIKEKVGTGYYGNASEVVRDALRQMDKSDQLFHELKREQLLKALAEGKTSRESPLSVTDIIKEKKQQQ